MGEAKKKYNPVKVGDKFYIANGGGMVVVLEYGGRSNILIKHMDDNGHEMVVQANNLRNGLIKNPFRPTIHGVGFIGVGEYKPTETGNNTKAYNTWRNMFNRCYCPKYLGKNPTYIGCSVDERWHNFQVFAKWMNEQHREDDWQLDKDLISNGNKVYSPETCRFIPQELNKLLNDSGRARGDLPQGVSVNGCGYLVKLSTDGKTGHLGTYPTAAHAFAVYKKAKEDHIKRVTKLHNDVICPLVYEALMVYEVKP